MNKHIDYSLQSDENLIRMIRGGNEEVTDFLLNKYKNMVRRKARTMFLIGGDTDDLIQEGMIGLYKAIRDYDESKEASFSTFANLCVDRQIYSAINASNRKKHSPLNSYVSLTKSEDIDDSNHYLIDKHTNDAKNPEDLIIDKENVLYIEEALTQSLSTFEMEVLRMYIDGARYQEIAKRMDKLPKAIDNALQRIKNKANIIIRESMIENAKK